MWRHCILSTLVFVSSWIGEAANENAGIKETGDDGDDSVYMNTGPHAYTAGGCT